MKKKKIFFDGSIVSASKTFCDILSPGILTGEGVFETMRAYGGKVFLLEDHLERCFKGLNSLNIKTPFSREKIKRYLYDSLRSNGLKNARLRLTIWRQENRVRISIVVFPFRPLPEQAYQEGFKAVISGAKRDSTPASAHLKSINYLSLLTAYRQAKAKGNDEAILLDQRGFIAEGSRSNVFFVKDETLYTPALSCGCLDGITRRTVLNLARKLGLSCHEIDAKPQDLFDADEAFLTNSVLELMPLVSVQGKIIGPGKAGFTTLQLLKLYRQLIKKYAQLNTF